LIVALLVQLRRRRLAEAALRESEERMSLAAEVAHLGRWVWDVVRDEVWMTDKGNALFGFPPDNGGLTNRFYCSRNQPTSRSDPKQRWNCGDLAPIQTASPRGGPTDPGRYSEGRPAGEWSNPAYEGIVAQTRIGIEADRPERGNFRCASLVDGETRRRGVEIEKQFADALPVVRGDVIHLQQVLLNLILNGMEAMSESPESNRRLTMRTAHDGKGNVEVAVEDSGPGIPPDRLPRLFDSFFTTKTHGMGLGLSIVRSIVEAHGGRIWAENNSSGGACFRFTLPVNGKQWIGYEVHTYSSAGDFLPVRGKWGARHVLRPRKMRSGQRFSYLALDPEETRAINAAYHQRIHKDQSNLIPLDPSGSGGLYPNSSRPPVQRALPRKRNGPHGPDRAPAGRNLL